MLGRGDTSSRFRVREDVGAGVMVVAVGDGRWVGLLMRGRRGKRVCAVSFSPYTINIPFGQ